MQYSECFSLGPYVLNNSLLHKLLEAVWTKEFWTTEPDSETNEA